MLSKKALHLKAKTGPDGAVLMLSANELVDTGFASRYRVFKGPMGRCKATTPYSLSLTVRVPDLVTIGNRVTTNY